MKAQLASLPPLNLPKLPQMSKDSSMPPEGLNTGIYRRTDQLLATLLKLSAECKVVDITGKTAGKPSNFSLILIFYRAADFGHSILPIISHSSSLAVSANYSIPEICHERSMATRGHSLHLWQLNAVTTEKLQL